MIAVVYILIAVIWVLMGIFVSGAFSYSPQEDGAAILIFILGAPFWFCLILFHFLGERLFTSRAIKKLYDLGNRFVK